jgi:hypothetical protein
MSELAGLLLGFILTLFVYSYIWRDNPLYRLAVHLLVGVSAGYAVVIVTQTVFVPIWLELRQPGPLSVGWLVPLLLALLLSLKLVRPLAWLGNSAVALLVGVGAAVALVGAISGTLLPQITAAYTDAATGILVALLTVSVLLYFHFTGRLTTDGQVVMPIWQRYAAVAGRVVITITFAALFAGLFNTAIALLAGRVAFFVNQFVALLGQFSL